MQFYKKRDFGELISSTFDFVKIYGLNYFKNYILLNGMILILLLVVIFIGYGEFIQQFFGSNLSNETYLFEDYFLHNQEILIIVAIISAFLFLLFSLVTYSYPILYMKRVAENGTLKVTAEEMISDLKGIIGKFFIFLLGLIFIFLPIAMILFAISGFLMIVLIGFALILFIVPIFMNLLNLSFFHYYHTDAGYFNSINFAIKAVLSKGFWKYLGSVATIYLIIQIITSIFTFIPFIFFGASEFISLESNPGENMIWAIFLIATYSISILASIILSNLIYINAGFIYYDARTDLHRNIQLAEIDSLGKSEI